MKEIVVKEIEKYSPLSKKEIFSLIEIPPKELGDYAFPCFILSKKFKQSPNEIAKNIAGKINSSLFEKIEAKGPYLNFFIDKRKLAETLVKKILDEKDRYGSSNKKEKIVIESPGPNTNKPLHLGHVRNIVLAQSIQKIFEFNKADVKMTDIINDRGIHICKSMVAYKKFGEGKTPESEKKKSDHFVGDFYVKFSEHEKELESEVKECLLKWENGDRRTITLWKKMHKWAVDGFKETYKKFDLKIDKTYRESAHYAGGKEIIEAQRKKGAVRVKEDGALYANLEKKNLGEKILIRADGTSIYITQDLNLAVLRKKELNFDRMFYVVANEQDYHFRVLFALLELFGYSWAKKLTHLNYGLVHLETGKMKSREGIVVDADDILENLKTSSKEELEKRYKLSGRELEKRSKAISMAALRYYLLKVERNKDLVFKPKESISFDGNTGPYLLYTYARAKSILRKAKYKKQKILKVEEVSEKEKSLIIHLHKFPDTVAKAYNDLTPNIIANYAYDLAKKFNEFYHAEQVIGSQNEKFRLAIVAAFSQTLKNSLYLLDIDTIEKM
ncbi:arginine--tRNA ligase [Candidatus Pacearchaeota archaeon]|nr:arginine--tRNA ligase [Candidatus Pacearchaeota archaeon]